MSRLSFVIRSMIYFWRVNLAVALGVVAATAVLTGALLVGDSMRGSLQRIALDGLGEIDEILLTDRFFREDLAKEIASDERFQDRFSRAEPMILFPNATAINQISDKEKNVTNKVTLIGCRNSFWEFGSERFKDLEFPGRDAQFDAPNPTATSTPVVINEALATDLGITANDLTAGDRMLTVQIPKPQLINADNPVGKKKAQFEPMALLKVVEIVPTENLGRFTLHPTQVIPRIMFLPLWKTQEALQKDGFANALAIGARGKGTSEEESEQLNALLNPSTADLGLIFKKVELKFKNKQGESETVSQYTSLSSDQLLLNSKITSVAKTAFAEYQPQPVMTYLANEIRLKDSRAEAIPFSMVASTHWREDSQLLSAISDRPIESPFDNKIVLNAWAADDFLDTAGILSRPEKTGEMTPERIEAYKKLIGSKITVAYYEPEASHGKLVERVAEFELSDVAAMVHPDKPFSGRRDAQFSKRPTLANDPDLTPFVPGLTDKRSLRNSDLPFDTEVRHPQDNDYWDFFRTTPKAFIALETGQKLWKSRFGDVTSLRLTTDASVVDLSKKFMETARAQGEDFGLVFTPIKRRNTIASSGSTPFDLLFLALSFFIILSALILIALLFRLGVEQKSSQIGLLAAVGLNRRQRSGMLVIEGTFLSVVGATLGVMAGIGYAKIMVYGLTTWWVDAVMTSFMEFHWTIRSLAIGGVVGVLVSVLTIWLTVRRIDVRSIRENLAGNTEGHPKTKRKSRTKSRIGLALCFGVAILLSIVAATSLGGEAQAGAFMGSGFLMLSASLLGMAGVLRRPSAEGVALNARIMAIQNAGRNPLRSTLTIGLVASATFLIVAVSSFHLSPTDEGTGGFGYIAESSRPIVGDFHDPAIRRTLLEESEEALENIEVFSIRFLPGDEAGCNNPFQALRPKILGVTDRFIDRFNQPDVTQFGWGGSLAKTERQRENPWELLRMETDDGAIPVVIDKNTAMYSLKIFGVGGDYQIEYNGETITFRVVGFLSNTLLQGSLIISEKHFEETFSNISGYRSFLLSGKNGSQPTESQISLLENELDEYGFDASSSVAVLSAFLAVQNTYLSTFQTLGAFGLLLGTFGLATVQLRNVVERKKELAVLRAIGFSKSRIGTLVIAEHSLLLLSGMLIGLLCALFAVVPHLIVGGVQVPLVMLLTILASILVIGLMAGLGAVASSTRTPILSSLRSD